MRRALLASTPAVRLAASRSPAQMRWVAPSLTANGPPAAIPRCYFTDEFQDMMGDLGRISH
jgi:hypothetical protein